MELKKYNIIELNESKERFKIIKVFEGGFVDMIALKEKHPNILPNYFETFLSIRLKNYKIIN